MGKFCIFKSGPKYVWCEMKQNINIPGIRMLANLNWIETTSFCYRFLPIKIERAFSDTKARLDGQKDLSVTVLLRGCKERNTFTLRYNIAIQVFSVEQACLCAILRQ